MVALIMCGLLAACGSSVSNSVPDAVSDLVPDAASDSVPDAASDSVPDTASDSVPDAVPLPSPGCGKAPLHKAGGLNVTINAGSAGDGKRQFFLSLPKDYNPNTPHKLIIGYPGTNWTGKQIQPYFNLEADNPGNEIFVYPDPLWRQFEGWGKFGGWVLGKWAMPAHGEQDLVFTEAVLDYMANHYCVDRDRIFATGHSWGGDMAHVVSCFLGNRFRASVPVAANRPYWFEKADDSWVTCTGKTAVWTMFGEADSHFAWQSYPGDFGDQCRDFWLAERQCDGAHAYTDLGHGGVDECVEFTGCAVTTRYCLYGAKFDHQIPDYYSAATMSFFRSF